MVGYQARSIPVVDDLFWMGEFFLESVEVALAACSIWHDGGNGDEGNGRDGDESERDDSDNDHRRE